MAKNVENLPFPRTTPLTSLLLSPTKIKRERAFLHMNVRLYKISIRLAMSMAMACNLCNVNRKLQFALDKSIFCHLLTLSFLRSLRLFRFRFEFRLNFFGE